MPNKIEESKKENDFSSGFSRAIRIGGATATVTIIALILFLLKIIPDSVSLAIGFFVSLPLVYSFVFGIITNHPNFSSVFRHYSFTAYLIVSLIIYMIVLSPSSILEGIRYFFYFVLGLVLASIGYFFYAISYRLLSKKTEKYRWRAIIGFGVSFIITSTIAFMLKYFNIFQLI